MPPPDPQSVLDAALHRALADLVEGGAPACALTSRASCQGWRLTLVASPVADDPAPEPEAPATLPALTPCQRDVLAVLSAGGRLTTSAVLRELARRGLLHGESTVKAALAKLVDQGRLENSKRAPRGYHVPTQPGLFPVT